MPAVGPLAPAQYIADVAKPPLPDTAPQDVVFKMTLTCQALLNLYGVTALVDSGLSSVQAINLMRSAILSALDRGVAVAAIGLSRGYVLPSDPRPTIDKVNLPRPILAPLTISDSLALQIQTDVKDLVMLGIAYDAGKVSFDRPQPSGQISSFEVSVDGIAPQSGDPLADLLGYQPDADFVKRKLTLDSLSKLDFSKRRPYMLFTADVITDGRRKDGTIICWQRMRDASGYSIKKRDVFAIIDFPVATLSKETLEKTTAELLQDPHFQQVLSFYDWIHPGDVVAFVDSQTHDDTLYSYTVAGLQRKAPSSPYIFDVPTSALHLTQDQAAQVQATIAADLALFGQSQDLDSVSPYPALAQVVFGDPGYGWILAGCNLLASQQRGDSPDSTRALSYVGAKLSSVLAAVAAGKIVVPNDVGQVHSAVDASVAAYGVSQTLLSVLDGIGLTMFSSKDDPLGFQPTTTSVENTVGGLAKIIGAIDPQTATLDPKTLLSALSTRTGGSLIVRYAAQAVVDLTTMLGKPPGPKPPSLAEIIGDHPVDLTTYDGIARLMQLIRSVYDFYPGSLS